MDLSGDLFNSSLQAKHTVNFKNSNFGYAGAFKNNSTHLHSNQPKFSPVSESSTHPPTKLLMLFSAHLQARELCPQTYFPSLPLEWRQVTDIPASINFGVVYKPAESAFYSTFARQLCDDTYLPGWLSAFPVLTNIQTHSGKLCTHKLLTITFNKLENLFSVLFFKCCSFIQSSAQLHASAARPLQMATGHIKRTCPLVDSGCGHGKV